MKLAKSRRIGTQACFPETGVLHLMNLIYNRHPH